MKKKEEKKRKKRNEENERGKTKNEKTKEAKTGGIEVTPKTLSVWDLDKMIRSAGAERVDEKASSKLGEILEDEAHDIISKARVYAHHAGRSFVTRKDIVLAAQHSHS